MMSFKEGFEAIDRIKISERTLGDSVQRIEALAQDLEDLRRAQAGMEAILEGAKAALMTLETAANGLLSGRAEFAKLAEHLPAMTDDVLANAEERLHTQQAAFVLLAEQMPERVEKLIEKKMNEIASQLEARLSDRLRDELKDTRAALRDAFEVKARGQEAQFDGARKEILAEMPRTLFGRRGR
jgi:prophage DNA circulation protein